MLIDALGFQFDSTSTRSPVPGQHTLQHVRLAWFALHRSKFVVRVSIRLCSVNVKKQDHGRLLVQALMPCGGGNADPLTPAR